MELLFEEDGVDEEIGLERVAYGSGPVLQGDGVEHGLVSDMWVRLAVYRVDASLPGEDGQCL